MTMEEQRLAELLKRSVPEPPFELSADRVTVQHIDRSGRSWLMPVLAAKVPDAPQIQGTPTQGQTVTCTQGTWTNSPTSFSFVTAPKVTMGAMMKIASRAME